MEQREEISPEKLRGGYYTPSSITDFIVNWGMEISPSNILEPSSGDGAFIKSLHRYSEKNQDSLEGCHVESIELIKEEALKSEKILNVLKKNTLCEGRSNNSEFFKFIDINYHSDKDFKDYTVLELKKILRKRSLPVSGNKSVLMERISENNVEYPDFIMGNPPYIRYQTFTHGKEIAERRLLELGVETTKHANSWLHFLAESVSLLNKDKVSRIGFVIPIELMHITYAKNLRRWLEKKLTKIRIIAFKKLIFQGVQQEVILFLGERDPVKFKSTQKSFRANLRVIQYDDIESVPENVWSHYNQKAPTAEQLQDKWTGYFLEKNNLKIYLEMKKKHTSFTDYMSINIGIVTGANNFFCIDKKEMESLGEEINREYENKTIKELKNILRKRKINLSGNKKELIEKIHENLEKESGISIKRLVGRSNEVNGISFTEDDYWSNYENGKSCCLLKFNKEYDYTNLEKKWKKKIQFGESQNLDKRYKTRIRTPWYWIPYVHSSPMCMFKRASSHTRLIVNDCDAYSTDTVYRIYKLNEHKNIESFQLAFCFYNSLTFLSCELEGRFYGGGVLELVPGEVEQTIFPYCENISYKDFQKLDKMVRNNVDVEEILDYTDGKLLSHISSFERQKIRSMWRKLKNRRGERAKSKPVSMTYDSNYHISTGGV